MKIHSDYFVLDNKFLSDYKIFQRKQKEFNETRRKENFKRKIL